MNDDQITSGPYEVEIHENGCVFITSDYASHGDICDFYHKTDDGEIVTKHNAIANAKFVGRAMNSHEALVEALNAADPNWFDQADKQLDDLVATLGHINDPSCEEAFEQLVNAIEAARRRKESHDPL